MKKILLIIAVAITLTNCITEKKRQLICNTCPVKITRHDSIIEKIVEVPRLVVGKQGPTVYLENPCKHLCDSAGNLKKGVNLTKKTNEQSVNIQSQGNGLQITSATADTIIKVPVKQKEAYYSHQNETVKYIPCKNERTALDGFFKVGFFVELLILAGMLLKRRFWP